jgi:hypothetical protein
MSRRRVDIPSIKPGNCNWWDNDIPDQLDVLQGMTDMNAARRIIIPAIRAANREHTYKADGPYLPLQKMVITEFRVRPDKDEFGNNVYITVQYSAKGYLASYGGHFDKESGRFVYQCYAD